MSFPRKIAKALVTGNWFGTRFVINMFHRLWWYSPDTWLKNNFLGYHISQCPFDLHLYQELIYDNKPNYILQTGVADGGSILYFATMLDLIGAPESAVVVGVDIILTDKAKTLKHPRVHLLEGSSIDPSVVEKVRAVVGDRKGMVVLDSDHSKKHVFAEMNIYYEFVAYGSYMVVEDTNVNGHPVRPMFGPGPMEAVREFLKSNKDFLQDDALWKRNKFSCHQGGWLKRTAES